MRDLVNKLFEKNIKQTFNSKPLVESFLLNHEKRPLLIDNLLREIDKLENSVIKTSRDHIETVVKSFTLVFAEAALMSKEQSLLSQNEKSRITKEREIDQQILAELEKYDAESEARVEQLDT